MATGTWIQGTLTINESLKRINDADPEAVVMIGAYYPCANFRRRIEMLGITGYAGIFETTESAIMCLKGR